MRTSTYTAKSSDVLTEQQIKDLTNFGVDVSKFDTVEVIKDVEDAATYKKFGYDVVNYVMLNEDNQIVKIGRYSDELNLAKINTKEEDHLKTANQIAELFNLGKYYELIENEAVGDNLWSLEYVRVMENGLKNPLP